MRCWRNHRTAPTIVLLVSHDAPSSAIPPRCHRWRGSAYWHGRHGIPELRRAEGDGGELRCRLQARDHEPQRTTDSLCHRGPADTAIIVADRLDWHWPLTVVTRAIR